MSDDNVVPFHPDAEISVRDLTLLALENGETHLPSNISQIMDHLNDASRHWDGACGYPIDWDQTAAHINTAINFLYTVKMFVDGVQLAEARSEVQRLIEIHNLAESPSTFNL